MLIRSIHTLLLLALAIALPAAAELQSDAPFQYSKATAYKLTSRQAAYVALRVRLAHDANLRREPHLIKRRDLLENKLREVSSMAQVEVDSVSYRNGWVEVAAKAGLGATVSAALKYKDPASINFVVEKILDSFTREGANPNLTHEQVVAVNTWLIFEMRNKGSALQQVSKEIVQKYFDLDINNLDNDPAVADQLLLNQLLREIGKNREELDQLRRGSKQSNEILAEKLDELNSMLVTVIKESDREKRQARLKHAQSEFLGAMGAMSGVASLMGENKAAEKFQVASDLGETMFALAATECTTNPAMCTNFSVMALNLGVKLIGKEKSESGLSQLHAAVTQLIAMVEEFRREALEKLDKIYYRMNDQFERSLLKLDGLKTDSALLKSTLQEVVKGLEQTRRQLSLGFDGVTTDRLLSMIGECFQYDENNVPVPLEDPNVFRRCRNYFMAFSLGDLGSVQQLGKIHGDSQLAILGADQSVMEYLLSRKPGLSPSRLGVAGSATPGHWWAATEKLLKLGERNPKYLGILNHQDENIWFSFSDVLELGQDFKTFFSRLLVNEQGALDWEFIDASLEDYRQAILRTVDSVDKVITSGAGTGPNPSIGFEQALPEDINPNLEVNYDLFGQNIRFCPGTSGKIELAKFETSPYVAKLPDRKGVLTAFKAEWFKFLPSLKKMVPQSLLWSHRMFSQTNSVKIEACFESIKLWADMNDVYTTDLKYEVTISIYASMIFPKWDDRKKRAILSSTGSVDRVLMAQWRATPSGKWKNILRRTENKSSEDKVERAPTPSLAGDGSFLTAKYGDESPLHAMWYGNMISWLKDGHMPNIASTPAVDRLWRPVLENKVASDNLAEFERNMRDLFIQKVKSLASEVESRTAENEESYQLVRRALLMSIILGLNLDDSPDVLSLIDFLAHEANLLSPMSVAQALLEDGVSMEAIEDVLDDRVSLLKETFRRLETSARLAPNRGLIFDLRLKQLGQLQK